MPAQAEVRAQAAKGKASPDNNDPQALAQHYLHVHGRTKGGTMMLHFWRSQHWSWDGRRYYTIGSDDLRARVRKCIQEEFERVAEKEKKTPLKVTSSLVTNVVQALESITLIPEDWEQPVFLGPLAGKKKIDGFISMANGLVDLHALLERKSGNALPHTPDWFSGVSLPYGYDPSNECPQWRAFLSEVLEQDDERIKLLQEIFGYCLLPNTSEQKFIVFEGEGANGKSVVCEILASMLGEENVSHVPLEVFGERFQLTATIGKLANIAPEVGELKSVAEGYLKQFTSGERMYFDRKGLPPIHVRPTARLVLAANNRPRFSDRSAGLWRRLELMPFRVTIPEEKQDRNLVQRLREELPGVFMWAVEGERRRRTQGGFTKAKVCLDALQDYRLEVNPARMYLTDHVEVVQDEVLMSSELYAAYKPWCDRNGYKPLPLQSFGKEVKRQFPGVERERERSGERRWFYRGIRLRSVDGDPEPDGPGGPPGSPGPSSHCPIDMQRAEVLQTVH